MNKKNFIRKCYEISPLYFQQANEHHGLVTADPSALGYIKYNIKNPQFGKYFA